MRLAIVSDIHGNLPALEAVCADIARRGPVDRIVNLGDSLSGPLLPLETARFLMAQRDWVQLAGNHERQLLTHGPGQRSDADEYAHAQLTPAEFAWMATLGPRLQLAPEVLLCHGSPRSDLEYLLETVEPGEFRLARADEIDQRLAGARAEVVLCGHSHLPRIVRAGEGGPLIVNPGSVGLQAYDDDHPHAHVVATGSPEARYALVERIAPGRWTAALIAVPYDHAAMASLAMAHARPDWAHALATGRMN
ncbi:metallophosphoesterase [Pelomonas sp. KK5]|uniref:metallophosphoesterase family protein n=1 Tax=Pelomonas sp. KK5 TaxID=1855730 RepID=UPI00097BB91E|nr:metallophosphoesterase family protein [Pelomonas sp. KK5]